MTHEKTPPQKAVHLYGGEDLAEHEWHTTYVLHGPQAHDEASKRPLAEKPTRQQGRNRIMEYDLDNDETRDLLDGLIAYDGGCISSGIQDCVRRQGLIEYLESLAKEGRGEGELQGKLFQQKMFRYLREEWLSEKRAEEGRGLEDLKELLNWLEHEMGVCL